MKTNVFKLLRSGVSLLLALCMVVGMCPVQAFAAEEDDTIHYVSLGASNTNGFGLDGYLPAPVYEDPLAATKASMNVYGYGRAPANSYPYKVAAALNEAAGGEITSNDYDGTAEAAPFSKVEVNQLALSSMRVEEVRYLLDDTMEPDAYMNWRFTGGQGWFEIALDGGAESLRKAYREALAEADVVTMDLGWNNFGVFAFNNIKTIMAEGKYWKAPDFSYYEDKITEDEYNSIRDKVLEKLYENISGVDASLEKKIELMVNTLTASTMGACYNYDIVMEKIYDLNPDAKVVVINIQNLADDLVIDFEGMKLALGDLYGELIDFVNMYRASLSPYADRTLFANAGDVTTFLDDMVAWDGDPATLSGDAKDCFDMYDDGLYVRSIVEYMMVGQALSGLFDGFRQMGAGYGLDVFKNDDNYTYEFVLTRTPEQLLALALDKLDFVNPGGDDADVEVYGAAVAKHLKNLRAEKFEDCKDAYNYVFEDLLTTLRTQKSQLEAVKDAPEFAEMYALVDLAINTIVPTAQAEFEKKFEGVYNTYHNTLNYAYDIVATIFQAAAKINVLEIGEDSMNGYGDTSDDLVEAVVNSFINGAMNKFYYELYENGVQEDEVPEPESPDIIVEPVLEMLEDPAVKAISVLAVRYDLGNSFCAHPSPAGHDQITEAVMNALENNTSGDEFTYNKAYNAMAALYEYLRNYVIENGADKVLADAYKFAEEQGYIEELNKAMDALLKQLDKELQDYVYGAAPVQEALDKLWNQAEALEAQLSDLHTQLNNKLAELEAQMAAAAGEVNEDLLATINATKTAIAQIEKAIAETEAALVEVYADIEECIATLDDLEEAIRYLDNRVVELIAQVEELNAILMNGSSTSIEAAAEAVKAAKDTIESTINLIQTGIRSAAELAKTVADLSVKASAAVQTAAENAFAILDEMSEGMGEYTEDFIEEEKAKLIAKIQAEYGEEIELLENNKELILAAGALAAKVVYDRETQEDGVITLLNAKIEQAKKDLETAEGEAKAELEANIQKWEQELDAVEKEAQAAYDAAVIETEKLYGMTLAYIDETLPIIQAEMEQKIAEAQKLAGAAYDAIKPVIDEALPIIENVLANSDTIIEMIGGTVEALVTEALQTIEEAINQVIDAWNMAYQNATTRAYLLNSDSYYVALGDSSAYGEKTYVDELAAELELANYKNLSAADNNVLAQMQALATDKALQAEIAKADLITVGFSQVPMMNDIVNTLVDAFAGEVKSPDWAQFVGEENVRYIVAIRDEIFEGLTVYLDEPMDEKTAALVTAAIEAYAYGIVAYSCVIPEMVNAIHAINPYAVVTLVGLYNPIDGVALDFGTGDKLELGDFVEYVVTAGQIHGTAYSMITGNSIYVNAPAVETQNTLTAMNMADLIELYKNGCATLNPNAKGHDYIQKCIYEALFTSNPAVMRVFGEDRYETALAAADAMLSVTGAGKFDTVVVATGRDFADALAGSYLAAEMEAPILLVKDSKADLVAGYIAKNLNTNGTIYVLGGEAAVSAATFAKLEKVGTAVRLEGENRYETNLAILNEAGTNGGELLIATGKNYADALAASSTGLPVMLVSSSLKAEQKDYLAAAGFSKLTVLGGVNAVSEELAAELAAYGNVDRIAGETRYETSAAIANHYFGGRNGSVVVASGRNFPDALCGGALAAAAGVPVVLTKHGGIEAADDYAVKAALGIVLGGEATGITKQDIVDIFELLSADSIEYVQY